MTDSSKSQKPNSKTQGVGFQKLDNQAESTPSESSAKPAEAKKPEPEVPTESISISPVTPEPKKAEAKPPEPQPEPVKAKEPEIQVPPQPPAPEPELTKAEVQPEIPVTPKPPAPQPEPTKAEVQPEVPVTPKPIEPKLEPISATQPSVLSKPEPINVVKPPAEIKMEPTKTPSVPVVVEEPTVETSQFDVQAIKDKVIYTISNLPENFSKFFGEYQRPLLTVTGIIVIIITAKALVGVLDSINDVPLVESTLEIVGMGYSGWFVYRYLLRSETRQELLSKFESLKEDVLGKDS